MCRVKDYEADLIFISAKRSLYCLTLSFITMPSGWVASALLHKSKTRRPSPYPGRTYATGTVTGRPSCVKRLSSATRTCSSTTWRSNVRAITRSPSRLKQCILVSTRLRRW